ncbi:MAG TPA: class I SAM-dependent methyltransferase [Gammaproteobacteria bacterium]|nr:class I SAM-dependent methyltransferase [Gammaproteobacteria bacterium]
MHGIFARLPTVARHELIMHTATSSQRYFEYLTQRSVTGLVYRKFLLYPRLDRMLQGRVLDYGCGIGDFLRYRDNSSGVDINQYGVDYCKSLGLDVQLAKGGMIPHPESSFDSVILDNVLEHIPPVDVDRVIGEIMRVLRPGGRLLIGVPGIKGYAADNDHKRFYTETDVINLLSPYGANPLQTLHAPLRSKWATQHLSQYCIYISFECGSRDTPHPG